MRSPDYAVTIQEFRACVKPGRALVMKICAPVLAVVGIAALAVIAWSQVSFYDLNELPWPPRLILAAVVLAAGIVMYKSVQEVAVPLKISFYRDHMVFEHESHPTLWREDAPPMTTEIRYKDVTKCIFSTQRLKVTFQTKGYTQTLAEGPAKQKSGVFEFSTLKAPDVDFAQLIEKHSALKVTTKN